MAEIGDFSAEELAARVAALHRLAVRDPQGFADLVTLALMEYEMATPEEIAKYTALGRRAREQLGR